jgi:hypothetical protein
LLCGLAPDPVLCGLGALLAATGTYCALLFTLAQYLQQGLGDSALVSGLTLVQWVAAFGVAGQIVRRLPSRLLRPAPAAGCLLLAAAYAAMNESEPNRHSSRRPRIRSHHRRLRGDRAGGLHDRSSGHPSATRRALNVSGRFADTRVVATDDLNPWQVLARRPAPLAGLVESEHVRVLAARRLSSVPPLDEPEPAGADAVAPAAPEAA